MEALGQAAKEIPAGTAMGAYLQEIRASGACGSWANGLLVVLWAAFLPCCSPACLRTTTPATCHHPQGAPARLTLLWRLCTSHMLRPSPSNQARRRLIWTRQWTTTLWPANT